MSQLQSIQAETSLAEKNKQKVLEELEQLQITKKKAFEEYNLQIERKQKEIEFLNSETTRLRVLIELEKKALEDFQKKTIDTAQKTG